jgi:DNA anti-recombination protein RmuC
LTTFLVILLLCSIAWGVVSWFKIKALENAHGITEDIDRLNKEGLEALKVQQTQREELVRLNTELLEKVNELKDDVNRYTTEARVSYQQAQAAADQAKSAAALTAKDFELEAAKRRDEFERQLA